MKTKTGGVRSRDRVRLGGLGLGGLGLRGIGLGCYSFEKHPSPPLPLPPPPPKWKSS